MEDTEEATDLKTISERVSERRLSKVKHLRETSAPNPTELELLNET
jgi:hypothetical protein